VPSTQIQNFHSRVCGVKAVSEKTSYHKRASLTPNGRRVAIIEEGKGRKSERGRRETLKRGEGEGLFRWEENLIHVHYKTSEKDGRRKKK